MERGGNCSSGAISPLFHIILYLISNFRSQFTYSFVKCGCLIYCFPHSLNSDMSRNGISKCFSESLGIRDNESRLYFIVHGLVIFSLTIRVKVLMDGRILPIFLLCFTSSFNIHTLVLDCVCFHVIFILVCVFACVKVLLSSQPYGVMSSAVSLPNHTFAGHA